MTKLLFEYTFGHNGMKSSKRCKTSFCFDKNPAQLMIQKYGFAIAKLVCYIKPHDNIKGENAQILLEKVNKLVLDEQMKLDRNFARGLHAKKVTDLRRIEGIRNLALGILSDLDSISMDYVESMIYFNVDEDKNTLRNIRSQVFLIGMFVGCHIIDFQIEERRQICRAIGNIRNNSWFKLDEYVWILYDNLMNIILESEQREEDEMWDEINLILTDAERERRKDYCPLMNGYLESDLEQYIKTIFNIE